MRHRLCRHEAHITIDPAGGFEFGENVKPHFGISGVSCLFDYPRGKQAAQAMPARCRADIKPLHLANRAIYLAKADAADKCSIHEREQEAPIGRAIFSRQTGEFFLVTLKIQTDAGTCDKFAPDRQNRAFILRKLGMPNFEHAPGGNAELRQESGRQYQETGARSSATSHIGGIELAAIPNRRACL